MSRLSVSTNPEQSKGPLQASALVVGSNIDALRVDDQMCIEQGLGNCRESVNGAIFDLELAPALKPPWPSYRNPGIVESISTLVAGGDGDPVVPRTTNARVTDIIQLRASGTSRN